MNIKIENGEDMARAFSDFVNINGGRDKDFPNTVTSDHRFLQQEMFMLMLGCIENWSEQHDNNMYDDRNKYTVKASKVILEALEREGLY